MPFLEGFGVGLAMVVFVGPVFFSLIETSIQSGKSQGLALASGIIVSDIVCAAIYFYGLNNIELSPSVTYSFTLVGALLLFGLGIQYIRKTPKTTEKITVVRASHLKAFGKGFAVNFINPFVFAVWAAVYLYAVEQYSSNDFILMHLLGVLCGIFTTDVLKVLLANKIKPFLHPKHLKIMYNSIGVIVIVFGIRLLVYLFTL